MRINKKHFKSSNNKEESYFAEISTIDSFVHSYLCKNCPKIISLNHLMNFNVSINNFFIKLHGDMLS